MLKRTAVLAALAAALVAAAPAQATTVKGSGTYDFGAGSRATIKVNASSQAAGAKGTMKIKFPDLNATAKVTCMRTSGDKVIMTGPVMKVQRRFQASYRWLILETSARGAHIVFDTDAYHCVSACGGPCVYAPLVRGPGIFPRR
jgi:hypothetical protein